MKERVFPYICPFISFHTYVHSSSFLLFSLILSSSRNFLRFMSSWGNPWENYEWDKGCIIWEISLLNRFYSCQEDIEDGSVSLLCLLDTWSLSLSLSLGGARVYWSCWSILEHLGILGLGFIYWRYDIKFFSKTLGYPCCRRRPLPLEDMLQWFF